MAANIMHQINIIKCPDGKLIARCPTLDGFFLSSDCIEDLMSKIPMTIEGIYAIRSLKVKAEILPQTTTVIHVKNSVLT